MSVLFRERRDADLSSLIPSRLGWKRSTGTKKGALAHDVAWACIRLRGDLTSTLPIDTFRKTAWGQLEVPKPPVLVEPGGSSVDIVEWMYSTQTDLDSVGNTFGKIVAVDGNNKPARIDLVAGADVTVQSRNGEISYLFNGKKQDPDKVWHERQFTTSGSVLGLSPVAYAAAAMQANAAAQDFMAAWYGGGLVPLGHLKYSAATVPPKESEAIKLRHRLSIENGEPMVTGKDWEYKPIEAAQAQANFITTMEYTALQMTRFFGVPADLVDVSASGAHITYANITQRNLQFLIMHLGPAIIRREKALSKLLPAPRFVKLNSDALLRMDPETVARMLGQEIEDRLLAPSEARALLNRAPFTDEQLAEFKELFPAQYAKNTAERELAYTIGEPS